MRPWPAALTATAVAAAAALAAACTSDCEELANRICACNLPGPVQDSCKSTVQAHLGGPDKPGTDDQTFCQSKLASCPDPSDNSAMCDLLTTPQGRINCGLAYEPTDGGLPTADAGTGP